MMISILLVKLIQTKGIESNDNTPVKESTAIQKLDMASGFIKAINSF
jgi:hypothetical protein